MEIDVNEVVLIAVGLAVALPVAVALAFVFVLHPDQSFGLVRTLVDAVARMLDRWRNGGRDDA